MRNIATAHATITRRMITPAIEAVSSPRDIFPASVSPARIMRMTGESMHIMTPVETVTAAFSLCSRNALASSIDTVTEKLIQDAIEHLMKGRTSFVIAHRLSTIRQADVILVVKDGKIIEQGRHSDLMKMKGYYYSLYTRQYAEETTRSLS